MLFKLQGRVKMANCNVNERHFFCYVLTFLLYKREEVKRNNIFTKKKLPPFTNSFQTFKRVVRLDYLLNKYRRR